MAELKLVVTKIGLAKITEATIENPLKLTHFAVGDGNGAPIEPNENMTGLVNEKYRDVLNDTYANENNLTIECVLRANAPITQGFKIFELGIFDEAGDMIAISQTPEQYRPIPSEGIATEWIASVVLQLSNTDNITIEIPETVFATTDALQRLLERVETIENNNKKLIESSVGIEKWFNTNNKYKDQDIIKIGVKTYGLAGSIVKIADYPTAFKNCGAINKGDGTFEIPKLFDGTIRHLPKGSTRELGSFQNDAMQKMTGMFGIGGSTWGSNSGLFLDGTFSGVFKAGDEPTKYVISASLNNTVKDRSSRVEFDNSLLVRTSEENRMKNTAGQWYVLLDIEI